MFLAVVKLIFMTNTLRRILLHQGSTHISVSYFLVATPRFLSLNMRLQSSHQAAVCDLRDRHDLKEATCGRQDASDLGQREKKRTVKPQSQHQFTDTTENAACKV